MPCFIAHSVRNGADTLPTRDRAVACGFAVSHQLASSMNGNVLVIVPGVQHLDSAHISNSLGQDFAKKLKKPAPFQVNGVTISRTSKIPTCIASNTVVWMLWPTLKVAESVTQACPPGANIVATEWVPFDELNRWRISNNAQVI